MIIAWLQRYVTKRVFLWTAAGTGVFFGMLPDLIGAYGVYVDHDHWTLYRNAHFGEIKQVLQYVPMYWLHLYLDSHMHGSGHRWWIPDERLWLEVTLWVINFTVIIWLLRTWKKRAEEHATHRLDVQ